MSPGVHVHRVNGSMNQRVNGRVSSLTHLPIDPYRRRKKFFYKLLLFVATV